MTNEAKQEKLQLAALYAQIGEICRSFKEIRNEAAGIIENSQMPDATLHLNDVLQATEAATNTILDAAAAIGATIGDSAMAAEEKQAVTDQVSNIYEACSFQDISGQRIKKVLRHLSDLEAQLLRLSDTSAGGATSKAADPLLNGPALAAEAPSQEEIDNMFKQA